MMGKEFDFKLIGGRLFMLYNVKVKQIEEQSNKN